MKNKLLATVDIGSHSCIMLIAAFEEAPAQVAKMAGGMAEEAVESAESSESAANESAESSEHGESAASAESAETADSAAAEPVSEPDVSEPAAPSEPAASTAPRKILVPKLQKIEVCRLGDDVYDGDAEDEEGKRPISEKKIAELVSIMTKFRMDLHALGADLQAVVMTEAMRKASNSEEVIAAVEKAIWVRPRIISGEEEAKLTFRSVREWHGKDLVTIDIGGGSTELSNGETAFSIPVGALKMFKEMGPIPGPEYKKFVKEAFKDVSFKGMTKKPVYLIGGTGLALAMVFLNKQVFDYKAIEGLELSISDLDAVTTRISNLSKELRAMLPGLENGRHDIIICGLFWLKSLLEKLRVESFRISTAGLRFGLLYPPEVEPEQKPKAKRTPPWLKKNNS